MLKGILISGFQGLLKGKQMTRDFTLGAVLVTGALEMFSVAEVKRML